MSPNTWSNWAVIASASAPASMAETPKSLILSMANAPLQILNQLPRDSAFLKFGAFACSPGAEFGASPTDTPR